MQKRLAIGFAAFFILAAVAAAGAAEPGSAPELADLPSFQEALKDQPAPASVAGRTVKPADEGGSCPQDDLAAARVRAGTWVDTYEFETGSGRRGGVEAVRDHYGEITGYILKDDGGGLIARVGAAESYGGRVLKATDCAGRAIGAIREGFDQWASVFDIHDASGRRRATTGTVIHRTSEVSLRDESGRPAARLAMEGWRTDRCEIAVSDPGTVDPRLAVLAAVLKLEADNRRAVARRRL